MYRIGLSSCAFALTEENFKELRDSGIEAIELSMELDQHLQINHKEVLELSKRYDVDLWSYHLPFAPFEMIDISSLDKDIRENSIKLYTELIEKAAHIGIDKFVVHPSGEPIQADIREERIKYSMQTLDILAELASRCGAVIAVEDLPRTCLGNTSDEIRRLIGVNEKLRVCFDTNHLLSESNIHFMEALSDKIVTVHVSDYDFIDEKHWLPGEGQIDWRAMLSTFQKINYQGVWMYELRLNFPRALTRSRELTFEDFRKNANAIFDGKLPEIIQ